MNTPFKIDDKFTLEDFNTSDDSETCSDVEEEFLPNTIVLEVGYALPKITRKSKKEDKYPFATINIAEGLLYDESFFIPGVKKALSALCIARKKYFDKKFVSRAWIEGDEKGLRIWRTK
jgi:hypothetical protein